MNEKAAQLVRAFTRLSGLDQHDAEFWSCGEDFIDALDDYIDSRIVASLNRVTGKIES